jgi:hypothetical protein
MEHDLVAYLLQADDPETHALIAEQIRNNPELAKRLELVQRALAPLEADKEQPPPHPGLVGRAIGRVAEYICGQKKQVDVQPEEPVLTRASALPPEKLRTLVEVMDHGMESSPSRWQRPDVFIGAAVLLLVVGLVLAAVPHLRHRQNVQACQNQMRQFHQALDGYSQVRAGQYPRIDEQPPHDTAASYVSILQESGCLFPGAKVACPAAAEPSQGYAYSLGFCAEGGQLAGLRRDLNHTGLDMLPILADRPSVKDDGSRGLSPDHRYGQNVLYLGGNVRFCTTVEAGIERDDIYRNRNGEVARGVDLFDTVLGFGSDRP